MIYTRLDTKYKAGEVWDDAAISHIDNAFVAVSSELSTANSKIDDVKVNIFTDNEEPVDAPDNSFWVDLDAEGLLDEEETVKPAKVYVVDAATTDVTTIDFSAYKIGDVILVTTS